MDHDEIYFILRHFVIETFGSVGEADEALSDAAAAIAAVVETSD
jgi:hypothetical protein